MKEKNNIVIYQSEDGKTKIDVKLEDETVWLSQQQMADLYDTTKQNISLHIKNIFDEEELIENSTVKEFLTVQKEGNRKVERKVKYYNLDMILSLGYRIKSKVATNFRRWATERLKEYMIKGSLLWMMRDLRAMVEVIIGKNYLPELKILGHQKKYYIGKSLICMQLL